MAALYGPRLMYPRSLQTLTGLRRQGVPKGQREYFVRKAWELRRKSRDVNFVDPNEIFTGMLLIRQAE